MDIGQRALFQTCDPYLRNVFQLHRPVATCQGLKTAIIMNFVEDSLFFMESSYDKQTKVIQIFQKYSCQPSCKQISAYTINALKSIYAGNDINLLERLLMDQEALKFFLHVYNEGIEFLNTEQDEDLILRYCAKILEANIYLYVNPLSTKHYLWQSSRTNIFILKENRYSILYPYGDQYSAAALVFQRAQTVNITPQQPNFYLPPKLNGYISETSKNSLSPQGQFNNYEKPPQTLYQQEPKFGNQMTRNPAAYEYNPRTTTGEFGLNQRSLERNSGFSRQETTNFYVNNQSKLNVNQISPEKTGYLGRPDSTNSIFKIQALKASQNQDISINSGRGDQAKAIDGKIKLAPVNPVPKLPICTKCGEEGSCLTLNCACKICNLCFEDQLFQRKMYVCPKCGRKISSQMKDNILFFIKDIHRSDIDPSRKRS